MNLKVIQEHYMVSISAGKVHIDATVSRPGLFI